MTAIRSDRRRRPLVAIRRALLPWVIAAAALALIVIVANHVWLLWIVIPAIWAVNFWLFFRR